MQSLFAFRVSAWVCLALAFGLAAFDMPFVVICAAVWGAWFFGRAFKV